MSRSGTAGGFPDSRVDSQERAPHEGHLTVVGAYYDLDTGKVELVDAPNH